MEPAVHPRLKLKNATVNVELVPPEERPEVWRLRITCEDGESTVVPGTLKSTQGAAEDLRAQLASCAGCREAYMLGGPSHRGSMLCRCGSIASGGTTAHCSCSTCF